MNAKKLVKNLIPERLDPLVQKLRRRLMRHEPERTASFGHDPRTLDCSIAYNRHGGYCVPRPSHHRPVAQTVLAGEVHEPATLGFLASLDPGGDIVHAGTFFGDFLPALSRSRSPGATVWAFEPNPENHLATTITILVNGLENVALHEAGLGSRRTTSTLTTHDPIGRSLGGLSNFLGKHGSSREGRTTVDVVPLDDVVPPDRRVTAIHLDVEGYEEKALAGALKTLARCRPTLVLETIPPRSWMERRLPDYPVDSAERVDRNWILRPDG